jgi:Restriction Endonuclease associating with ARP
MTTLSIPAPRAQFASQLRHELGLRNRLYARGRAHVESYGDPPVIVYAPENGRHGNFFDPAYAAILARPEWARRFDKVHTHGLRALPRLADDPGYRWRELDSSMSSDALLMNIFCTPGVLNSAALRAILGIENGAEPIFGWKARVPLAGGRFDRTEVDMRLGSLLVEAKLTESDFQTRECSLVESYRDFASVFDTTQLQRVTLPPKRRRAPAEFPEAYSQEGESEIIPESDRALCVAPIPPAAAIDASTGEPAYASYQLIRNVLAAHAGGCAFCVLHDERRPDLREEWFQVMAAVRGADLRTRLKVLTWQELAAFLPEALQQFLAVKYGIAAPGRAAPIIGEQSDSDAEA